MARGKPGMAWKTNYSSTITGRPGRVRAETDTAGTEIVFGFRESAAPEDGYDLILTIDRTIQHFAERELRQTLARHEAERGTIIVMEVATGAILAMASYPTFDPNHYDRFEAELFRNPAISEPFEPGSTLKLMTVAAAIGLRTRQSPTRHTLTPGEVSCRATHRSAIGTTAPVRPHHGHGAAAKVAEHGCHLGSADC